MHQAGFSFLKNGMHKLSSPQYKFRILGRTTEKILLKMTKISRQTYNKTFPCSHKFVTLAEQMSFIFYLKNLLSSIINTRSTQLLGPKANETLKKPDGYIGWVKKTLEI
jgi:hypothetical protein